MYIIKVAKQMKQHDHSLEQDCEACTYWKKEAELLEGLHEEQWSTLFARAEGFMEAYNFYV